MATAAIPEKALLVEVKGLRHYYSGQDHLVLDDVNLTLVQGEIVGLLGRSGSGKSTLLRSIAGLIHPSEGVARMVPGPDVTDPSVAMVFQTFALFPWLTVLENVELGLEALKVPKAKARERALAAIDLIGLDGFENAYPKELSGGMRQRVGLARALVVDPSLLLMDEPFSALDVLTAETLRTDLLDLWSEGRVPIKSILIVTHNIEEAVLMCDRILVFSSNPGRVVAEIKVDLPQPRDRLDPAFRALVDDIYARMTARTEITAPMRDGLFPGTGIAMVLPRVSTNSSGGAIYYDCPASACSTVIARAANASAPFQQLPNPVAAFATDNNGTILSLPSVAATGAVSVSGTLYFGIGTQTNNALGSASVLPTDAEGYVSATYNGTALPYSFLDSGSNYYYFVDNSITTCTSSNFSGFYCPASALSLTPTLAGSGGAVSAAFTLYNAQTEPASTSNAIPGVGANPNTLSFSSPIANSFDFGLPFFYGRNVYTAIAGRTAGSAKGPYFAY